MNEQMAINNMDEPKRENNKLKSSATDNVKSMVSLYLNKRHYPSMKPRKISKRHFIKRAVIESRFSRSNSILFSCSNSDPLVVEYNFTKFIYWLKDQMQFKRRCLDIEKLIGPLFCHLYLDVLNSGHSDKASDFFVAHVDKVDTSKCEEVVKKLLAGLKSNNDVSELKTKFRSSKVVAKIKPESLNVLKKFVLESCHMVFLQVLHMWFDFGNDTHKEIISTIKESHHVREHKEKRYEKLLTVIKNVKKLPMQVLNIKIVNARRTVTCGLLRRQAGFIAFAERNILKIMPIHVLDSLFDVKKSYHQIKFNHHTKNIYSIAVSLNNDILCTSSADRSICLYNTSSLELRKRIFGHTGPVYCIKISENSKYLASGSQDCTARLWSVRTGKSIRIFAGHTQPITCVQFHPNTLYLATGSSDKNIRIWCLKSANCVRLLHAAKGAVYSIAFDPSGIFLASASEDKKIRIWDLTTGKISLELKFKEGPVTKLIWGKHGKQLCGAAVMGIVKVWDVSYIFSHHKNHKSIEPLVTRKMNSTLLSLEYSMGTYATLTV